MKEGSVERGGGGFGAEGRWEEGWWGCRAGRTAWLRAQTAAFMYVHRTNQHFCSGRLRCKESAVDRGCNPRLHSVGTAGGPSGASDPPRRLGGVTAGSHGLPACHDATYHASFPCFFNVCMYLFVCFSLFFYYQLTAFYSKQNLSGEQCQHRHFHILFMMIPRVRKEEEAGTPFCITMIIYEHDFFNI